MTVTKHKCMVMKDCFRVGLYKQGLTHDLSKYSPTEFLVGAKYFQGDRSPNNAEREEKGYSSSWLHHKGRNKHHFEYWLDYDWNSPFGIGGMKMPVRYVVEMFIDRIAACKTYQKEKYTKKSPLLYYEKGNMGHLLHKTSRKQLEALLHTLAEKDEKEAFRLAKYMLKKEKRKKGRGSF